MGSTGLETCRWGGGGGGDLLYLLCLISNTLPVGTVFLASINSSPSSPPATDHLLQPSPSTPTPPHLQKRKQQAATG